MGGDEATVRYWVRFTVCAKQSVRIVRSGAKSDYFLGNKHYCPSLPRSRIESDCIEFNSC